MGPWTKTAIIVVGVPTAGWLVSSAIASLGGGGNGARAVGGVVALVGGFYLTYRIVKG